MMNELKGVMDQIDRLKQELDEHGPLDQATKERLAQKIRLEWNFDSNVIEGNQLDWDETRSLLLHGLTSGKPLQDHLDMKGHNEALKKLEQMANREIRITEKLIRDFHKTIIEDPFKEHPEVVTGAYKRKSNYLYNEQGERVDFADPDQVPVLLNELINWTNNGIFVPKRKKQKYETHPLFIAATFHLRFIDIHPFDDGNGRICRILMNIILIQCGFPPIIIQKEDRRAYFQSIQKAREEGEKFLAVFLGNELIKSLELYLKAARGEPLEEPDDLDKKLAVLEKELEGVVEDDEVKIRFNEKFLENVFDDWVSTLLVHAIGSIQKFNKFFIESQHKIYSRGFTQKFVDAPPSRVVTDFMESLSLFGYQIEGDSYEVVLATHFGSFKKGGLRSFGCRYRIRIKFEWIKFIIAVDEFSSEGPVKHKILYEKLLHQKLTRSQILNTANKLSESIYQHIDYHSKKAGLR